jgi:hypothetical protein
LYIFVYWFTYIHNVILFLIDIDIVTSSLTEFHIVSYVESISEWFIVLVTKSYIGLLILVDVLIV